MCRFCPARGALLGAPSGDICIHMLCVGSRGRRGRRERCRGAQLTQLRSPNVCTSNAAATVCRIC